ncbi:retropepsin-like aspartic protease [Riemerella columbina]|uniref:retropepsin-like aspartic protease n=1 Tax=Riemerella columbina TaxID=103810 RepID=UPI00266F0D6F|nr:retropepsin-like aspartic protease [Riemerella columbina]WKS94544.1 retropepsin-like domain-containing protein [Riemerella columbina]
MKNILTTAFLSLVAMPLWSQVSPDYQDHFSFETYKDRVIFIQTKIQNQPLSFFFDTGATTSLLDQNTAEKLGIKSNHQQDVSGAGGKKNLSYGAEPSGGSGKNLVDWG